MWIETDWTWTSALGHVGQVADPARHEIEHDSVLRHDAGVVGGQGRDRPIVDMGD